VKLTSYAVIGVFVVIATKTSYAGDFEGKQIIVGGDLRLRHDLIDEEMKSPCNRERIRARISITSSLKDNLSIGMQLATGGDDPTSRNQTLGDGFSSKAIMLDRAYLSWNPSQIGGLAVTGGKFANPFVSPSSTELLWDSDLNPEGLTCRYSRKAGKTVATATAAYFIAEDRKEQNDISILGIQASIANETPLGTLLLGAGYYDYQHIQSSFFLYDSADSFGNSADTHGKYSHDYNDTETFFEYKPVILKSVMFFGDYVVNTAPGVDKSRGWLVGTTCGSCSAPHSIECRYSFRRLENDAVVGAFTDSDFAGGGTGGKGHEISFDYQLTKNIKTAITYFINEKNQYDGLSYHRMQLDMNVKL